MEISDEAMEEMVQTILDYHRRERFATNRLHEHEMEHLQDLLRIKMKECDEMSTEIRALKEALQSAVPASP